MALRRQTNITQRLDNEEYLVYTASNGSVYRKDGSFRTSITPLEICMLVLLCLRCLILGFSNLLLYVLS